MYKPLKSHVVPI